MEKSIELFYKEGSSDKVYQVSLEKKAVGYVVNFAFGRRGTSLKTGTKTEMPVSLEEANKVYNDLVNSKMAKGYAPVAGSVVDNKSGETTTPDMKSYNTVDKEALKTGVHVQLLNPIEEEEVEKYLNDDKYLAQEKFDGRRNPLRKEGDKITSINRRGLSVGYPTSFDQATLVNSDFLIDGEAVGDFLYVFDILEYNHKDLKKESAEDRLKILGKLFKEIETELGTESPFVMVQTAFTTDEKKKLFKRLKKDNAEGIVFKLKSSPYTAGRPNSGGNQIKFKFVATASFIVLNVNKKRSVAVGLYDDDDNLINVGNVTIPPNKEVPEKDQIIEVRYLYAYKGGSIYQPVYLMVRDDIDRDACKLSQLKYKQGTEEDEEEN